MRHKTLRVGVVTLMATATLALGESAHFGSPSDLRGTIFVTERALGSVTAFDAESGEDLWTTMVGV